MRSTCSWSPKAGWTDLAAAGVGARFHQGFVNAIADIWQPVLASVEVEMKKAERPLW